MRFSILSLTQKLQEPESRALFLFSKRRLEAHTLLNILPQSEDGITVKDMDNDETNSEWDTSWFCVQQGWNDEITDAFFLQMIEPSRRHPVVVNGSVHKELLPMLERCNKRALAVASSQQNLVRLREQVMRLPFEPGASSAYRGKSIGIAVHEGILYISTSPAGTLLHQQAVILDPTTHRPSPDVVLGALYDVLL
jgi:hypothetical protein